MRRVVLTEGREEPNGVFVEIDALTPIAPELSIWFKGMPLNPVGHANRMIRDLNGDISFDITIDDEVGWDEDFFDFSCAVEQVTWRTLFSNTGNRYVLVKGTITGIEVWPLAGNPHLSLED